MTNLYKNSTELTQLAGYPVTMGDMAHACLYGRLNLFLVGDTGEGKTQLARDMMSYFGDKATFVLGRNDMDTRELFQQLNPDFYKAVKEGKLQRGMSHVELTDKVNYHLIVVDELPNCVPSVRGQLFNLFDGFIELHGKAYPIGNGYSVGIATGNIGQKFTESSNDLGRALKDRMHVFIDTDYFMPQPSDTLEILAGNTNPRVNFETTVQDKSQEVINRHASVVGQEMPFEKLIMAAYLRHGLDYAPIKDAKGNVAGSVSKRKMKDRWPTQITDHEKGSDAALVLPLSMRAAKSTLRLSQSLDSVVQEKAGTKIEIDPIESMLNAYKFVAAYSGVLNEIEVDAKHGGDKYKALDAVSQLARKQYTSQSDNIRAGLEMAHSGKLNEKVLNLFTGRWEFMKDILTHLTRRESNEH